MRKYCKATIQKTNLSDLTYKHLALKEVSHLWDFKLLILSKLVEIRDRLQVVKSLLDPHAESEIFHYPYWQIELEKN